MHAAPSRTKTLWFCWGYPAYRYGTVFLKFASKSPISFNMPGTRGEKRAHPYSDFNHNKNHKGADFTEGEKFQKCTEFIIEEASKEHCINRTNSRSGKSCTCSCLHNLEGKDASIDAIARYMVFFYNTKKERRKVRDNNGVVPIRENRYGRWELL